MTAALASSEVLRFYDCDEGYIYIYVCAPTVRAIRGLVLLSELASFIIERLRLYVVRLDLNVLCPTGRGDMAVVLLLLSWRKNHQYKYEVERARVCTQTEISVLFSSSSLLLLLLPNVQAYAQEEGALSGILLVCESFFFSFFLFLRSAYDLSLLLMTYTYITIYDKLNGRGLVGHHIGFSSACLGVFNHATQLSATYTVQPKLVK